MFRSNSRSTNGYTVEDNNSYDDKTSRGGGSQYQDNNNDRQHNDDEEYTESNEYESEVAHEIIYETELTVTDTEKSVFLSVLSDMRNDSTFCDVAFICQGKLIRGHRCVVSAYSRWLRGLLFDNSPNEVVSLDMFTPDSLTAVFDYMYGVPLRYNIHIAEGIMKVVRRFEMEKLEQHCWRFLMSVIDNTNCEYLHELADRYDCPPLKLNAWKILQESLPGYQNQPTEMIYDPPSNSSPGHGLTGPGEAQFLQGYNEIHIETYNDDSDNYVETPSILMPTSANYNYPGKKKPTFGGSSIDDDDDDDDDESSRASETISNRSSRQHSQHVVDVHSLPQSASAADVIKAWAHRLDGVYQRCIPNNASDYEEPEINLQDVKVKVVKVDRPQQQQQQNEPTLSMLRSPSSPSGNRRQQQQQKSPPTPKPLNLTSNGISAHRNMLDGYDWKGELRQFYLSIRMPEKIASLDEILDIWVGKEDQMLSSLIIKYRKIIPPEMLDHLEGLLAQVESHSEYEGQYGNAYKFR